MESKMKCKIIMLDAVFTQKQNQIIKQGAKIKLPASYNEAVHDVGYEAKPQHLYLVSDEEIKTGDYYTIYDSKSIHLARGMSQEWYNAMCKKVIATTDTTLNLPLIPQSFIEKYVEVNGKIEEVMVEIEKYCINDIPVKDHICVNFDCKVKTRKDNTVIISKVKDTWNYDEHCTDMQYYMEYCQLNGYVTPQKWLAEIKHY